ncbi:cytochrome c biogenesis protein ResB [Desulfopila sp. IMCC35006]|uniref:cytochrome c biogenesis protein ResB n=1 Tax=Desulfopila sp. IMCC35006 TaxID=2569542 RepID=UPI0010AC1908|nr:cytochrome c biogenesis protein ResB [Desulfopila sp. IMCC35006]TKB27728.1 cytochrome c biogenesis protein ResB [Desulfopila sp. IMCC35006]
MIIFNQLWNFFSSVKLAIFTLCALAGTSIVGTIIPQGESTSFYVQNFGRETAHFFQILDIPNMYYSWWFLGLLGILSTNLIVCSLDRFPAVWKIIKADNLAIEPERIEKMANFNKWEFGTDKLNHIDLAQLLKQNGWHAQSKKIDSNELFFCQKGRWSRTGVYIVHLSILLIFTGAIIGHIWGFKGSVMIPEMSSTQKVFAFKEGEALELGFTVRCNSFAIEFYNNGMPKEYKSSLTIIEQDQEVLTRDIEVNSPLTYKGITFYQSSYQGYQDFILSITENSSGESKVFTLPFQKQMIWEGKDLHFGIVNAEAVGQRVVRAKVWFKSGDSPASIEWLNDNVNTTFTSGAKEYTLAVKQMYATGLQVAKDPGVWVVYIGCGLMLLGLYVAFFRSHQRIWLFKKNGSSTPQLWLSGSTNKNKMAFTQVFEKLKNRIEHAVQR